MAPARTLSEMSRPATAISATLHPMNSNLITYHEAKVGSITCLRGLKWFILPMMAMRVPVKQERAHESQEASNALTLPPCERVCGEWCKTMAVIVSVSRWHYHALLLLRLNMISLVEVVTAWHTGREEEWCDLKWALFTLFALVRHDKTFARKKYTRCDER